MLTCQILLTKRYLNKKNGQITGQALANKLINTTNKEENQSIVKNINANKKKLYQQEKTTPYDWVIKPTNRRINLRSTIKLILDFNVSDLKNLV